MSYHKTPFRLQAVEDNGNILGDSEGLTILSKTNQIIAEIPVVNDFTILDGQYIVKACNEYPNLVDLLSRVRHTLKDDSPYAKLIDNYLNK